MRSTCIRWMLMCPAASMPTKRIQGTKPWVFQPGASMQVRPRGNRFEHGVAGFLKRSDDCNRCVRARFDRCRAYLAWRSDTFGEVRDGLCYRAVHNPQMVQGHPYGPIAAAIFKPGRTDQNAP